MGVLGRWAPHLCAPSPCRQTEQQWQGEEGDVNVNDVVDTLGQKKARHAAEVSFVIVCTGDNHVL